MVNGKHSFEPQLFSKAMESVYRYARRKGLYDAITQDKMTRHNYARDRAMAPHVSHMMAYGQALVNMAEVIDRAKFIYDRLTRLNDRFQHGHHFPQP